jgi:hypothetical protein
MGEGGGVESTFRFGELTRVDQSSQIIYSSAAVHFLTIAGFGGVCSEAILNERAVLVWNCLAPLVVLTTIFTVGRSFAVVHSLGVPSASELLWALEFSLVLVWWVSIDRRIRGFSVPFEFDAFVFFMWPFIVPYYLYRTRGRRGLLLVAGVYSFYLTPFVVTEIARIAYVR